MMDERTVSNTAALMKLWRKFLVFTLSTRRPTLAGSLVNTARQCCAAQSGFNHRVRRSLSVEFSLWSELKTLLVRDPTPADPAELDPRES